MGKNFGYKIEIWRGKGYNEIKLKKENFIHLSATPELIKFWTENGRRLGAAWMIVVYDSFDRHDYPEYSLPGETIEKARERIQKDLDSRQSGSVPLLFLREEYNLIAGMKTSEIKNGAQIADPYFLSIAKKYMVVKALHGQRFLLIMLAILGLSMATAAIFFAHSLWRLHAELGRFPCSTVYDFFPDTLKDVLDARKKPRAVFLGGRLDRNEKITLASGSVLVPFSDDSTNTRVFALFASDASLEKSGRSRHLLSDFSETASTHTGNSQVIGLLEAMPMDIFNDLFIRDSISQRQTMLEDKEIMEAAARHDTNALLSRLKVLSPHQNIDRSIMINTSPDVAVYYNTMISGIIAAIFFSLLAMSSFCYIYRNRRIFRTQNDEYAPDVWKRVQEKWVVIECKTGKEKTPRYDAYVPISEGTYRVQQNGKYGLLRYSSEILPCEYDLIEFSAPDEDVYIVRQSGKYGLVSVILYELYWDLKPCADEYIRRISSGVFSFRQGSAWHILANSCILNRAYSSPDEVLIEIASDSIYPLFQLYLFRESNGWGLFSQGITLIEPALQRENFCFTPLASTGAVMVEAGSSEGIFYFGKMILPFGEHHITECAIDTMKHLIHSRFLVVDTADQRRLYLVSGGAAIEVAGPFNVQEKFTNEWIAQDWQTAYNLITLRDRTGLYAYSGRECRWVIEPQDEIIEISDLYHEGDWTTCVQEFKLVRCGDSCGIISEGTWIKPCAYSRIEMDEGSTVLLYRTAESPYEKYNLMSGGITPALDVFLHEKGDLFGYDNGRLYKDESYNAYEGPCFESYEKNGVWHSDNRMYILENEHRTIVVHLKSDETIEVFNRKISSLAEYEDMYRQALEYIETVKRAI
ncbi:MAG TPA: hypothetical protein DC049_07740 [Spirochaetia bacterium]|nr:hypothetical protein [Spirochaetia bacterium]